MYRPYGPFPLTTRKTAKDKIKGHWYYYYPKARDARRRGENPKHIKLGIWGVSGFLDPQNTFANHEKAKYWSSKNYPITPNMVSLKSHKKFWFNCNLCGHHFLKCIADITRIDFSRSSWCRYCSGYNWKWCGKLGCEFCFKKSFASHEKVKYWSDKNDKNPYEVALSSNEKCWFDCNLCGHPFLTLCYSITRGHWCRYCSGYSWKWCGNVDCDFCFKKSFASHEKVKYWSKKNKILKPYEVARGSNKKCWFDCPECNNDFDMACNNVNNGRWCPYCVNKTETKLLEWLQKQPFIKKVKRQYKPKWCSTEYHCIMKGEHKTRRYQYSYDFLITLQNGKQLIIELDGPQHFVQVSNWKGPFHNQIRDAYKERKARQYKLKVIRILQEDVYYDRNDWESNLIHMVR